MCETKRESRPWQEYETQGNAETAVDHGCYATLRCHWIHTAVSLKDGWMDGGMDECMKVGWLDGWIDEYVDGWMEEEWKNGWLGRWLDD